MKALTPKQAALVREYLVDLNATQAAIRAGYSPKTANVQAAQVMGFPHVKAAIDTAMAARSKRTEITADRVLKELAKIGFSNIADYTRVVNGGRVIDLTTEDRDVLAAVAEVTVEDVVDGRGDEAREIRRTKFKLHDKRAALVDIGRHLGMFKEKLELSGPDGGPVQVEGTESAARIAALLEAARVRKEQTEGA